MEEITDQILYGDNLDDIFTLFKTLDQDSGNTRYIYSAMQNPHLIYHMDIIMDIFINKKLYLAIYYFLDGYTYYNNYNVGEKYKKMMLNMFRQEPVYSFFRKNPLDEYYINLLDEYFKINYASEISIMG